MEHKIRTVWEGPGESEVRIMTDIFFLHNVKSYKLNFGSLENNQMNDRLSKEKRAKVIMIKDATGGVFCLLACFELCGKNRFIK